MKLLNNIFGLGYIAFTLVSLFSYKRRIETAKKQGNSEEERKAIADACHFWSDKIIKHFNTDIKVVNSENLPEEGPVVYVCNHQSYADILTMLNVIKHQIGFIAKEELTKIPVFAKWILRIRSLFIIRGDARESLKTINDGAEMIKQGYSLVIFPEGTRSRSSRMGTFKPGSLKLATKAKAKIVPITINGSYKMYEETGRVTKNTTIEVIVHQPVDTASMDRKELAELSDRIETTIKEAVHD